jgi:hypothetical protein
VPKGEIIVQPYLFSQQKVSREYYVFGASKYAISLILVGLIHHMFKLLGTDHRAFEKGRKIMVLFVWFQFFELIEYFLTYNEALFFIQNPIYPVGINITNIKIVVMFIILAKEIAWKPGKA